MPWLCVFLCWDREGGFLSQVSPGFALDRSAPPPSPPLWPRPLRAGPSPHAASCLRRRSLPPPGTPGTPALSAAHLLQPAAPLATCTYSGLTVLTWFQHRRKLAVLPASLFAHVSELRSHGDPGFGGWDGPAGPALWGRSVDCRRSG